MYHLQNPSSFSGHRQQQSKGTFVLYVLLPVQLDEMLFQLDTMSNMSAVHSTHQQLMFTVK